MTNFLNEYLNSNFELYAKLKKRNVIVSYIELKKWVLNFLNLFYRLMLTKKQK